MTWKIIDVDDDAAIMAVLDRDRAWAVYAICDLDPPYRKHARYIGAYQGDVLEAIVLLYRLGPEPAGRPDFAVVVPCGTSSGVRAVLERVEGLPATASLQVRPSDLAAVDRRYRCDDLVVMERMVVNAVAVRGSRTVSGVEIVRLDGRQAGQLVAFYERLPGRRPSAATLLATIEHGIYYGAFDSDQLLAVAGTHALSDRFSIATVGGVFTDPVHRGRGLAQATTGAVVQALAQRGFPEIALNVRADNVPAISAYARLGFREYCKFWEGDVMLRAA